jgi:hypothetical protein
VIVAARLGVLVLIVVAAVWALVPGQRQPGSQGGATGHHACPMHPQVAAPAPGQCPICGMALEKVEPLGPGRPRRSGQQAAAVELPETRGQSPVQAESFLGSGVAPVHRRALAATTESPAWLDAQGGVTAVLFDDEVRDLGREEGGSFFAARAPGAALAVERAEAPPIHWRGSMWRVRFRFRPGSPPPRLPIGATGWVERPSRGRASLVVLSSAVLQAQSGPYLLAISPDRRSYRRQPIATGRLMSGYTVVISGASERDLVLGVNAFSANAHAQLEAQRGAAAIER